MTAPPLPQELSDAVRRLDRPVPRYTSYPPVPVWSKEFGEADYRLALAELGRAAPEPIGVYVHLPFCALRCLYCGCNATVTHRAERVDRYLDRLEEEVGRVAASIGRRLPVASLHLGGGTPNYLSDPQLERLGELLCAWFDVGPDTEASVEADPRQASWAQMQTLQQLGFRRISFGVQDVDPGVQRAIGRLQSLDLVRESVTMARAAGFESVNLDLMYGLPRQSPATFEQSIREVLALEPDRVACFGYAHVPWMQPHQKAIDEAELPGAEARLALFQLAVRRFGEAGYVWIGLDHFARPDDPLAVALREGRLHRDFMGYTTRVTPTLLAFGASGIGEVQGRFIQTESKVPDWEAAVAQGRLPVIRGHVLTDDDRRRRAAILRLMCDLRLPLAERDGPLAGAMEGLLSWEAEGLVAVEGDQVAVTPYGRFFLRNLCAEFDAYFDGGASTMRLSRGV